MEELIQKGQETFIKSYAQLPIVFESGEGVYMIDDNENRYLDFVAGIAVNTLGYSHKKLTEAIKNQVDKFMHCSNLYWNKPSIELAGLLTKYSGLDKVFFCNSGAEAVESALKLARKYSKKVNGEDKYEIISMKNSFHGRTLGAITATGQEKYQKGLNPLLPGINYCEYNNIESLKNAITDNTCAIILEPIQGEGGIRPANKEYLKQVRQLCDDHNLVLIFDEVQSGIGRSGELFAYQVYDVKPDIVTMAKGLGSGMPIGGIIVKEEVASGFQPGDHASTFGGNPLVCSAAKVVIEELMNNNLISNVKKQGKYLEEKLQQLKEKYNFIIDVRGIGLMQGIELSMPVKEIVQRCLDNGLLLVGSGTHVIRFVPPLVISEQEIDEAMGILDEALSSM